MGDLGNMPAADTRLLVRTHCMGHLSQGGNCILIQIRVGASVKRGGGGGGISTVSVSDTEILCNPLFTPTI